MISVAGWMVSGNEKNTFKQNNAFTNYNHIKSEGNSSVISGTFSLLPYARRVNSPSKMYNTARRRSVPVSRDLY